MAMCSAVFNLHYWLGVEETLGPAGARDLLKVVDARVESTHAPAGRKSWIRGVLPIGLGNRRR